MKKEKEKIKKPWYKRKLIWAIIIIVFIMAIGSNGESTSTENTKKNTAAADTQQQPNTESADTTKDEDTAQAAVSEDTSEQKEDAAAVVENALNLEENFEDEMKIKPLRKGSEDTNKISKTG